MPIDASIPLGYKPVDAMSSLKDVTNLARSQQELQTGQIQQQRQAVQLEQEQGALKARKDIGAILNDPEIRDPDSGLVDLNKYYSRAIAADPQNYLATEVGGKIANANTDMMKVKATGMALAADQQALVGKYMGILSADPNVTKEQANATLDDVLKLAPASKPAIDIIRKNINGLEHPGTVAPVLAKFRDFGFPLATQTPAVSMTQTGAANVPTQTNTVGQQVGPVPGAPAIQNQVGPSQSQTMKQDLVGNAYIEEKLPSGQIVNRPAPNASAPPLLAFPPGESQQSAQTLGAIRTATNQAAAQVPEQHFNNHQIVKLADEGYTGTNAALWAKLFSATGLQLIPGDDTANYQQLGHFMALQAQNNAKAMGAGTDAARGISEQATGSTKWTPEAIKRATRVNDALSTGVELFNRGMEAAINSPENQKSIFAARDFQNAWSQNFDVNAMRLYNAVQGGDKKEQQAVIDSVGGKNSPGAKALAAKMRALDSLATQGRP